MNRVMKRSWIMVLFILILLGGTSFFLYEYYTKASEWVLFTGSPHVYQTAGASAGIVTDREGTTLLDTTVKRTYSQDQTLRQAVLHWLGDRQGNINDTTSQTYTSQMVGYDAVDGVYSYGGQTGEMTLTLSGRVQKAALEAMAGRKGTLAVYNYKTGEILCAVSTPTFDPDNVPDIAGDTTGQYEGAYLNRFLQSTYPPGSIFKIVTTAAALETVDGILDMTFTCRGIYEFGIDKVTCETAHGTKDLKGALASSCNCCFAQIAQLVGKETMTEYVEKFGLLDNIRFDGFASAAGSYDVSDAAPVELAWSCIGQYTDLINPCSYMTFMGAIAAGGKAAQPYLVERVSLGDECTYEVQRVQNEPIMSRELAETLQEYMRNNVEQVYGAGNFPGLTVCAKSGTSELGGGRTPNAMFSGFVLDSEYPLAFIVVVENGGYGSSTCVPILSRVLAECKAVLDGE